jgi:hypothetical protein
MHEDRSYAPKKGKKSSGGVTISVKLIERILEFLYDPFTDSEQSTVYQELRERLLSAVEPTDDPMAIKRVQHLLDCWKETDRFSSPKERAAFMVENLQAEGL